MMLRIVQGILIAAVLCFAARAKISFAHSADVPVGRILLGDLSELSGDSSLVERLKVLEVGRIDYPGRESRVSIEAVRSFYLRSVCPAESLDIEGSGSIRVHSRSHQVDKDSLKALILQFVSARIEGVMGDDWEIEVPSLPKQIEVPESAFKWIAELPANFDGRGQEVITLKADVDGNTKMRFVLPFTVRRWVNVVHSVSPIQRGQPVQMSQIALQRVEITHQPRMMVNRLEDAVGRMALRTIASNLDLSDSWLERPWTVREGDDVRMNVQVGAALVSVMGKACQNGYTGQRIEVENLDSGKRMQAEVGAPGEVRVIN